MDKILYLGATDLSTMMSFIDAAYGVHDDFKNCTRAGLTMGHIIFSSTRIKQKLNTKRSNEAELVGTADYLQKASCLGFLIESKGSEMARSIMLQDKQSTIFVEANVRASCSKRSRHLNTTCFHVADVAEHKEVETAYCPTEVMLAIFFYQAPSRKIN